MPACQPCPPACPPCPPISPSVRSTHLATFPRFSPQLHTVPAHPAHIPPLPLSLVIRWALTQEERRAILEEKSHHNQIGMDALPAVARRLHHCRDLGTDEPFDFITYL